MLNGSATFEHHVWQPLQCAQALVLSSPCLFTAWVEQLTDSFDFLSLLQSLFHNVALVQLCNSVAHGVVLLHALLHACNTCMSLGRLRQRQSQQPDINDHNYYCMRHHSTFIVIASLQTKDPCATHPTGMWRREWWPACAVTGS